MAYDIIGDIHGHAEKLKFLLRRMGYEDKTGVWAHPGRIAIFVGDLIDRGPQQLETVSIVRKMVDEGVAQIVLGNHEFNAIGWHTPNPFNEGEFLRPRSGGNGRKNRQQHQVFLAEVEAKPEVHADIVAWFRSIPMWLDLPGIRVVHACWHPHLMSWLSPQLTDRLTLPDDVLIASTRKPKEGGVTEEVAPSHYQAVEAILKGLEIRLPRGRAFYDKDGHERYDVRVRWWDSEATTYRTASMWLDNERELLPDDPIPEYARVHAPSDKPIFFGYYWFKAPPRVVARHIACVDYSAGNGGPLIAYRWDGEAVLTANNFVSTD